MSTYSLKECILEFVEPAAYQAMLKGNINRVSIFNIACRQAFKENSQTKYAEALRGFADILDETGVLHDSLHLAD